MPDITYICKDITSFVVLNFRICEINVKGEEKDWIKSVVLVQFEGLSELLARRFGNILIFTYFFSVITLVFRYLKSEPRTVKLFQKELFEITLLKIIFKRRKSTLSSIYYIFYMLT